MFELYVTGQHSTTAKVRYRNIFGIIRSMSLALVRSTLIIFLKKSTNIFGIMNVL